jgi:hypothetical protein
MESSLEMCAPSRWLTNLSCYPLLVQSRMWVAYLRRVYQSPSTTMTWFPSSCTMLPSGIMWDIIAGIKLDCAQETDFCRQKGAFYLTGNKKVAETIIIHG